MSTDINYELLSRYTDGDELNQAEVATLLGSVVRDHVFARACSDDLFLHRAIAAIAAIEQNQNSFVNGCVAAFVSQTGPANSDNHDAIQINPGPTIRINNSLDDVRRRRARSKWAIALLALATVVVLGWFVTSIPNLSTHRVSTNENSSGKTSTSDAGDRSGPELDMELPTLPDVAIDDAAPHSETNNADPSAATAEASSRTLRHQPHAADHAKLSDGFIASVSADDTAVWVGQVPGNRIATGSLNLKHGTATVELDSHVRLVLTGPTQINLISESKIAIESGRTVVDTSAIDRNFSIQCRDATFDGIRDAKSHLFVDSNGTEVVVSRGQMRMNRRAIGSDPDAVQLAMGGLSHAYINNFSNERQPTPSILIAHGQGKYLGQMGFGQTATQFSSPEEFEEQLKVLEMPELPATWNARLSQPVQRFNQMFRQLRTQFEDQQGNDTSLSRLLDGYSLQGEIIVDGDNVRFSSSNDTKDFTDHLRKRFDKADK